MIALDESYKRKRCKRLIDSVLALVVAAVVLLLAGCSTWSDTSAATLAVDHPQHQLPGPGARKLRLSATGDQTCPGEEELTDIETDESDAEVVVSASFRIGLGGLCELRTATETFDIVLDRPLGKRVVIDSSGGRRAVIWSPELRERHRKTARLTARDALRFATSRFPQAAGSKCVPMGPYFECRYVRGGQRYRLILIRELGGTFSVFDRPIRIR